MNRRASQRRTRLKRIRKLVVCSSIKLKITIYNIYLVSLNSNDGLLEDREISNASVSMVEGWRQHGREVGIIPELARFDDLA
jgi:hypothetical protein